MKKKNIAYTILAFLLVVSLGSCRKDPVVGGTATEALSGTWWVKTNGSDNSKSSFYQLDTYNTAANVATEMWINDGNRYYGLKSKIKCDVNSLTFSATNVDELYYAVKVTITEGKILKLAATAPGSKDKVDSIYFKAVFTGDATIYTYSGYKRTGFASDDH